MKIKLASVLAIFLVCVMATSAAVYAAPVETYVCYSVFGAAGDGVRDDFDAIIAAHAFANEAGLPVRADPGMTYYIGSGHKTAEIQTCTDWTGARFIIDNSVVSAEERGFDVFRVTSKLAQVNITGVETLKKNQETIEGWPLPYDSLVDARDSTTMRFIRRGNNANDGAPQRDVFLVDKDGNVDQSTPILWDYDTITSLAAHPIDEETLTIRGGHFTTIDNQAPWGTGYYSRGICVLRSNVLIDGIYHEVTGEQRGRGGPNSGFLVIYSCAGVAVQNCTFSGRIVSLHGSYDIQLGGAVNVTFRNCGQSNDIHDTSRWGIMGSNYVKNIEFDTVSFSRFDAHAGVHNASIRNSQLGHQGINLIGSGRFLLENTTVSSSHLVNLRGDYGSTWEGEFIIRGCVFTPTHSGDPVLIGVDNDGRHDFGYPCYLPRKITVDGLKINDGQRRFFRREAPFYYFGPSLFSAMHPYGNDALFVTLLWDTVRNHWLCAPPYPIALSENVSLRNIESTSGRRLKMSKNIWRFCRLCPK